MNNVKIVLKNNKFLTDEKLDKLEKSFSKYEADLKDTEYISFFVEGIMIGERLKLRNKKSKYYISKRKSLKERMNAYYEFRSKFLEELEKGLKLFEKLYINKNSEVDLYKRFD